MWRTDRCAEITKGTIDCDERMRSSPNRRRLNYDFIDAISFVACMRRRRPDQLKSTNLIDLRKTQIYTKRGNVEMPLTGHMSDFDNAILLDKITLIKTNALIQVRFRFGSIWSARMCSMRIRLIDSIHLVRLWLVHCCRKPERKNWTLCKWLHRIVAACSTTNGNWIRWKWKSKTWMRASERSRNALWATFDATSNRFRVKCEIL